jgi:hypothetical protein
MEQIPSPRSSGRRPGRSDVEYEYRTITMPRETSRGEARRLITEAAEHGHWELARVRLYLGGRRQVQLRRRIVRVPRTG